MAIQDLNISHPSFAAESASLNLVSEKERKKQQKDLLNFAATLRLLEKELSSAKQGLEQGKNADGKVVDINSAGNSKTSFEDAMADMALALELLQVEIAKYGNDRAKAEYMMSEAQVEQTKADLANIEKALKKFAHHEKIMEALNTGSTVVMIAIMAIMTIFSLFNPSLLVLVVLMAAFMILQKTGALKAVTKAISKVYQAFGIPKKAADIMAGLAIIAVMIFIAVITGGAFAPEAAEVIGEEAGEVADNEMQEIVQDVENEIEDGINEDLDEVEGNNEQDNVSKKSRLGRIKAYLKAHPSLNAALFIGPQAIMDSGLAQSIAVASTSSKKKQEEIELTLSILFSIMALVTSLGSFAALADSASTAAGDADGILGKLQKLFESSTKLSSNLENIRQFMVLAQAGATVGEGVVKIEQGMLEKELAEYNADLNLVKVASEMLTTVMQQSGQNDQIVLSGQKLDARTISNLFKGEAAFANLFSANSPV